MATTKIMKLSDCKDILKNTGGFLLPMHYWDCKYLVDMKKLKKTFPDVKRVKHILIIKSTDSEDFVNHANKDISYKNSVVSHKNHDGAYYCAEDGMYISDYPIGNAIIVIK